MTDDERFTAAEAREKLMSQIGDRDAQERAIGEMLRLARTAGDPRKLARALDAAGTRSYALGRTDDAITYLDEAIAVARHADLVVQVRAHLAQVLSLRGEYDAAVGMLEDARKDQSLQGDVVQLTLLHAEASIVYHTDDVDRGRRVGEEMLRLARRLGNLDAEARAHLLLGVVAYVLNSTDVARAQYGRAMELFDQTANRQLYAASMMNIGICEYYAGHFERALDMLDRGIAVAREVGYTIGEAYALQCCAEIALERGELEAAERLVELGLSLLTDSKAPRVRTSLLVVRGSVLVRSGNLEAGTQTLRVVAEQLTADRTGKGRSEDLCTLIEAASHVRDRALTAWAADELRATLESTSEHPAHPARVAAMLACVALDAGDDEGARRCTEVGLRLLADRLGGFSEPEDREAYQRFSFVATLGHLARRLAV